MMSGNIGLPLSKDILYTSSTTWAHPFSNREKIYLGLAQLDPFQRPKNHFQLSPFKGLRCAIRAPDPHILAPVPGSLPTAKLTHHAVLD